MTKPKNTIAIMAPSFNAAGVERVLINLANKLTEVGYEVIFIVINPEGPLKNELFPAIRLIQFPNSRLRYSLKSLITFFSKHRPSYFIGGHDYVNFIAIIANILTGSRTKIIAGKHAFPNMDMKRDGLLGAVIPFLSRFLLSKSFKIVTVSSALRNYVVKNLQMPSDKVVTIYNPTIDEHFWTKSKINHVNIPFPDNPYFVSVGRLAKVKGFDLLIRSFSKTISTYPNLRLIIIGDGEERENIELQIHTHSLEEKVLLMGEIANPYPYIRDALALISSSNSEALGLTIIEALALEKPIISTATTGAIEVLEDGKYGMIVPIDDEAELTTALERTYLTQKLMRGSAPNERWKDFEANRVISEYEKILNT